MMLPPYFAGAHAPRHFFSDQEAPLLEMEYVLPIELFAPELHQLVVDIANERLSVLEGDLRIFTPVDTGRLVRSLYVEFASVGNPVIRAGYTEPYAWFVEFGFTHWLSGEFIPGYRWFSRLVGAHLERLQGDLFQLAQQLAFPGPGLGPLGF